MVLRFRVEESSLIQAPSSLVYTVIADYNQHHGNIIPPKMFAGLKVLKGSGVGTGTRIACTFRILGQTDTLIMDVTELQSTGNTRIIQEIDSRAKNITQFLITKRGDNSCTVTIRTDTLRQQGWVVGAIDQFMSTMIMRHMYREELKQLDKYAQSISSKDE
mmetsp:Transcript_4814/g.6728  ORF Transcript_4814/g.6728 Transcript_4814/m.6728 type:complete len:161 (-) Transcript_4814:200-682(-)|eukprot:CAMPEP_0194051962 /NCGR_PEP_ID=MMETSP0009_2-20130614/43268_1 /TAXON_ID=210454 /ORGANISM="Grammatophora oceanica, Strain CCMP 410" /LENGTH=160 /DNA_ID=CAMNT_0038699319 /DNA_START=88 /DNA_END=570 /DNA_ORIENTATION=+